jgi:alcohol dehydrogenase (cytochrome c)
MKRLIPIGALLAVTALGAVLTAQSQGPRLNVTNENLLKPTPDMWPSYFGDYTGRRFSPLTKINDKTVKHLSLAWMTEITPGAGGGGGGIKATPLLFNGVLYFSTPDNAYAHDARTGRQIWQYIWPRNRGGIHIGNRGVAIFGNTLYFSTPDCNLVALDASTGKELWYKEICSLEMVYYSSVSPLVVKDKLLVGVSGDDLDMPGYMDARNLQTGDLIWRWYVTPQKADDPGIESWPNLDAAIHGGGMTWQPFTYDPEANLIYVATGNPQPVIAWKNRPGANLFTGSVVAVNADTGKMAWYFQTSPRDTHDLDSTQAAVLIDLPAKPGVPGNGKYMVQANRAGWFVVVDRSTGRALVSTEYIKTKQFLGTDERGQPIPNEAKDPSPDGTISTNSATNWFPPAYNPMTELFYVNAARSFGIYYVYDLTDNPMGWGGGGGGGGAPGSEPPSVKAIDVRTGKIRWATPRFGGGGGLMTTAGNLVFGGASGGLQAFNATTGEPLWVAKVGNVSNGPMTYLLDDRQYVVAGVGNRLFAFVYNE